MTADFAKQLIEEARAVVEKMRRTTRHLSCGRIARLELTKKLCEIVCREQVPDPPGPDPGQSQPPEGAQGGAAEKTSGSCICGCQPPLDDGLDAPAGER